MFKNIIVATLFLTVNCLGQSENVLSSRFFHPKDNSDTLNTISVLDEFKVDKLVWMYCPNDKDLNQLKEKKIPFTLALNPQIPDSAEYTTANFRIKDIYGRPLVAPWMRKWKITNPYWGCVNNPEFYKLFLHNVKVLIDKGAYGIFVDDARFNFAALDWGGCYCNFCFNGFNDWLLVHTPNHNPRVKNIREIQKDKRLFELYRKFQEESVVHFYNKWMDDLKTYSHYNIVFQTNNFNITWDTIFSLFDEGICEIRESDLNTRSLDSLFNAIPVGKKQILSLDSENKNLYYSLALYSFLYRVNCLIPWDVFMASKSSEKITRYYGKFEDFGDLFNFLKTWEIKNIALDSKFLSTFTSIKFSKRNLTFSIENKSNRKYILIINESFDSKNIFELSDSFFNDSNFSVMFSDQMAIKRENNKALICSSFLLLSEK